MTDLNVAPLVLLVISTAASVIEEIVKFSALVGWEIVLSDAFKKWFAIVLAVIGAGLSLVLDGTVAGLLIGSLPPTLGEWLVFVANVLGAFVTVLTLATGLFYLLIKRLGQAAVRQFA